MNDSIRIHARFSFKGKIHQPEMVMDLDELAKIQHPNDLYAVLARKNDIDLYSYEYEMLQAEALVFDQPKGRAAAFMQNGKPDWKALHANGKRAQQMAKLSHLARQHMGIEKLSDIPGLEKTLLEAWEMGAGQSH